MAQWDITYSKDNNTGRLEIESAQRPSPEEAVQHLLRLAEQEMQPGEYGEPLEDGDEPPVVLLKRYGITLTGIAQR